MTVVLCLWLLAFGEKPLLARLAPETLVVKLPTGMLDDAATRRRLLSGLTLSIALETQLEDGHTERRQNSLVTVRYEVWEERIIVQQLDPSGTVHDRTFKDLDQLFAWLARDGLPAAQHGQLGYPLRVRITCRITPYSAEEARFTRDWFAQRLEVARAGDRGLVGGEGTSTPSGNNVFEVLMSGGIRERPIKVQTWKWTLQRGSSP